MFKKQGTKVHLSDLVLIVEPEETTMQMRRINAAAATTSTCDAAPSKTRLIVCEKASKGGECMFEGLSAADLLVW